jgi:hypothetical protein
MTWAVTNCLFFICCYLCLPLVDRIIKIVRGFKYELTEALRCQIGTSKKGSGGSRYLPYVFTEPGVAMLSSALNSERAVLVNIEIMRAFVKLRQLLISNAELAHRERSGTLTNQASSASTITTSVNR